MTNHLPLKGAWLGSRGSFLNFGPHLFFGTGETMHFKLGVTIEINEYTSALFQGMYLGSRDLFNFGEMNDNISEIIQDTYI